MMTITARLAKGLASLLLIGWAVPGFALEFTLPAGMVGVFEQSSDPDTYFIPVAAWNGEEVPVVAVDGSIQRASWRMSAEDATQLQVFEQLRAQISAEGYTELLNCVDAACGGFDFYYGAEVLLAPDMYVNLTDFRFLSAVQEDQGAFVSVLVSRSGPDLFLQIFQAAPSGTTHQTINIPKARAGVVSASVVGSISERLESEGHVVLADLVFESGSAQLGAGSFATLNSLASYLTAHPNRQIALVGHTDAVGSLVGNISLSKQRAASVADRLAELGVSREQISSQGVGYLSPIASNLTAEGRELNRRVEAVLTSTE